MKRFFAVAASTVALVVAGVTHDAIGASAERHTFYRIQVKDQTFTETKHLQGGMGLTSKGAMCVSTDNKVIQGDREGVGVCIHRGSVEGKLVVRYFRSTASDGNVTKFLRIAPAGQTLELPGPATVSVTGLDAGVSEASL